MTDTELDQVYAALCEAMAQVGQGQTPLLLSMLCLSLISRSGQASEVLPLIANARQQCDAQGGQAGKLAIPLPL